MYFQSETKTEPDPRLPTTELGSIIPEIEPFIPILGNILTQTEV